MFKTPSHGVNLMGVFQSPHGTSEAVRCVYRSIQQAQIPFVLLNYCDSQSQASVMKDVIFSEKKVYRINLINFHAESFLDHHFINEIFSEEHYNIGYWNWELSNFPDDWLDSFLICDEIWVPSSYTQAAIQAKSPIPVVKIPYSISIPQLPPHLNREYFGLNLEHLIFLSAFDYNSIVLRKNPHAVIHSFIRAFESQTDVKLIIKMLNCSGHELEIEELKKLAEGRENILFIDRLFTREEAYALTNACDVFVSLHRCEGFGFNLCEAMAMGKPVIATNYSANTDYMNNSNGYLVDYEIIDIDQNYGNYKKGEKWADPSIDHAASLMKHVYNHHEEAYQKGLEAAKTMNFFFSDELIGEKIKERLNFIYNIKKKKFFDQGENPKEQINITDYPIVSHRFFLKHGIVSIKKMGRWLLKPGLEKQTQVNHLQFNELKILKKKIKHLENELIALKGVVNQLKEQLLKVER